MSYKVFLSPGANEFLEKLDKKDRERMKSKLEDLKENPELGKPLTGKLAGLWSLRTGDYRALYQIRHSEILVLVLKIRHRKNAYDF